MLITAVKKKSFVLSYSAVLDFCRAIEKTQGKSDYIYMACDGEVFSLYSASQLAFVLARGKVDAAKASVFSCGVDALRFSTLFKKLSADSEILLTPSKGSVVVEQGNIRVQFPLVDYAKESTLPSFRPISGSPAMLIATDIGRCFEAMGATQRFSGVLIDNTFEKVTRITKFSDTAIRTSVLPKISEIGERRIVISPEMAKAARFFGEGVEQILFGENHFGLQLRSGTLFYMPLLVDTYPREYVGVFGLVNEMVQVKSSRRSYAFSGEHFQAVLDLVSSVIGAEESQVQIEVAGVEDKTGCPVWKVSARSFNGCEAAENIVARAPVSNGDIAPCRVHKVRALSSLKLYGDDIVIHDTDDRVLTVTDNEGADVTVLFKSLI